MGVHYHADAHNAATVFSEADTGLGLYNEDDYTGFSHASIIGIGFDGVADYGSTLNGDTARHGAPRKRKLFSTDASALKILYLAISEASKKWTMPDSQLEAGTESLYDFL